MSPVDAVGVENDEDVTTDGPVRSEPVASKEPSVVVGMSASVKVPHCASEPEYVDVHDTSVGPEYFPFV